MNLPTPTIAQRIYAALEADTPSRLKKRLGGSDSCYACDRRVFNGFRWWSEEKQEGRIIRLLERGNREEDIVVADIERIGGKVLYRQETFRISDLVEFHIDGIVFDLPELNGEAALLEGKTHNRKSFNDLEKKQSIWASKVEHWNQCQMYMEVTKTKLCLYFAVCKDDDRIYCELIPLNADRAKYLLDRARFIGLETVPPNRISADGAYFVCKTCPYHEFCHGDKTPRRSCRSCAHFIPGEIESVCGKSKKVLSHDDQVAACVAYQGF